MDIDAVKAAIRDVPDFPVEGIVFKDITPVLADPALFKAAVGVLAERTALKAAEGATRIAAIDARGFIFGAAVAERLGLGFVPIRKAGKLPYTSYEETYELEYGTNTIAIHQDAFTPGEQVVLMDDLLATGGTCAAAVRLIRKAGGVVVDAEFLVELGFLNGRDKLPGIEIFAPIVY